MGDLHNQQLHDGSSASSVEAPLDPEAFRKHGHLVVDFIADYYKNIDKYPVRSRVEPGYLKHLFPDSAPHEPDTIQQILQAVENDIIPGLTHWQSPNHFAYFPCNASIPGFLGEMLSTGFNVPGFNWMSSPAATELENIVMDWLGKMLHLPSEFLFSGGGGGVIEGTTCEAILCTLVAARDQKLKTIGRVETNINKRLTVYGSDQTHSAFQKAAKIAGISPGNFRAVATTKESDFGLTAEALRGVVRADVESGLVPFYVCATIGTTPSAAVDDLGPICEVAREFGMWVHVDGAYAGSACNCPEHRHHLDGVEKADSFSLNAHKWFLTNLECCCMWVKNPGALTQSLSTNPEYLHNKASDTKQVVDYKDWQVTLTRGFRSLKLWLVIRSYGVGGLRKYIRRHIEMARDFEGMVRMDGRFEIVVPRNFSTVCFRVSPSAINCNGGCVNAVNVDLLERINESGKVFMTHAVIGGVHVIRFVVGGSMTEEKHVRYAWEVVQDRADQLLSTLV